MSLRLPLGAALVGLAVLAIHDGVSNVALAYAALAIGIALALTVALDAIWAQTTIRRNSREDDAPRRT